jgi:RNA recognition motif-containing protein
LEEYFGQYGPIVDCVIMHDPETKRSRGFGFVSFATDEAYRAALKLKDGQGVAIKGKTEKPKVEVKEKKPKKRR